MIHWLADGLRRFADLIDRAGAPKAIGWSFTIERGKGVVFHEGADRGCRLWYLNDKEYDRAHDEASHPTAWPTGRR